MFLFLDPILGKPRLSDKDALVNADLSGGDYDIDPRSHDVIICTGTGDVNLPAPYNNAFFMIINGGSGTVTVKDDLGATVATLLPEQMVRVASDGSTWFKAFSSTNGKTDQIVLADPTNENIDHVTEKDNQKDLNIDFVSAIEARVLISSIVDNLSSVAADQPLSANQGRVLKNLIDLLQGDLTPQGNWNADTNTPDIAATATTGDFWIVSVSGATNLDGITDWVLNDWAVKTAAGWAKVDNTANVLSVNGYTGNVVLSKSDVGLGNVDNTSDADKPISSATQIALDDKWDTPAGGSGIDTVETTLTSDNTHLPTSKAVKDAIDAVSGGDVVGPNGGVVDNEIAVFDLTTGKLIKGSGATIEGTIADNSSQVPTNKAVFDALALKATVSSLSSHTSNTSNPHSVSKSDVGLGNADNTSDANKPISTATQAALNGKAAVSHTHVEANITNLDKYSQSEVDALLVEKLNLDGWTRFTPTFTRIQNNKFSVTDNATNQAIFRYGRPIRYADTVGTWHYGMVIDYTTGTITLSGEEMTTSYDTYLDYGVMEKAAYVELFIAGASFGATDNNLLWSIMKTRFTWTLGKAHAVAINKMLGELDTTSNGGINVTFDGNEILDSTHLWGAGAGVVEFYGGTGFTTDNIIEGDPDDPQYIDIKNVIAAGDGDSADMTVGITLILE